MAVLFAEVALFFLSLRSEVPAPGSGAAFLGHCRVLFHLGKLVRFFLSRRLANLHSAAIVPADL